jgi:hypothetical protein
MSLLPNSNAHHRNWRQAILIGADGARGMLDNSWELLDPSNHRVARINIEQDGPETGHWRWFILVTPNGTPLGESGFCRSEHEAREICERKVPDWTVARLPHGRNRQIW